jgi:hypothetical protein
MKSGAPSYSQVRLKMKVIAVHVIVTVTTLSEVCLPWSVDFRRILLGLLPVIRNQPPVLNAFASPPETLGLLIGWTKFCHVTQDNKRVDNHSITPVYSRVTIPIPLSGSEH